MAAANTPSLKLKTDNRNSVEETTVDLYAKSTQYSLPSDDTNKGSGTSGETKEYSDKRYEWRFWTNANDIRSFTTTGNNNSITVDNLQILTKGSKNVVKVTVEVLCKEKTTKWERKSKPEGGYTDWEEKSTSTNNNYSIRERSNSKSLDVYSKNSKSSSSIWGDIQGLSEVDLASSATYIDGNFKQKAEDWLDQWQIWRSWYDQEDRRNTTSWNKVSLIASSPISASWYNACASACNGTYTDDKAVSGGYIQDIRAVHFRDISNKVTSWPKKV